MGKNDIMHRLQQFSRAIKGNPREQLQQLLNSGRVSQAQYDEAVEKAKQLQKMMGINAGN
jgi:hypothetical protein